MRYFVPDYSSGDSMWAMLDDQRGVYFAHNRERIETSAWDLVGHLEHHCHIEIPEERAVHECRNFPAAVIKARELYLKSKVKLFVPQYAGGRTGHAYTDEDKARECHPRAEEIVQYYRWR